MSQSNQERVAAHFNGLTPAEAERLALLAEECAEVIQIVAKIQRHGYESVNPLLPDYEQRRNRSLLEMELGHVFCATTMMMEAGDVAESDISHFSEEKVGKVGRWLHHNAPTDRAAAPPVPETVTRQPGGEPSPRMMQGNSTIRHFSPGGYHASDHEWCPSCDVPPFCTPVEAGKLDAKTVKEKALGILHQAEEERLDVEAGKRRWEDPTQQMLNSPEFEAIWQCIKKWDIAVPDAYVGYTGATGNHVAAILRALRKEIGYAE